MTVLLVHMLDDVFLTVKRFAPFFYNSTQILKFLVVRTSHTFTKVLSLKLLKPQDNNTKTSMSSA
jgi:hypothetical protein